MRLHVLGLALALGLLGCSEEQEPDFGRDDDPVDDDDATDPPPADADDDGYSEDVDCDDDDPYTYPGAPELCDEADNNCNGEVDEEPLADLNWYVDADGDGYGAPEGFVTGCIGPKGSVLVGGDCDDDNATIHPGALIDGYDADCDGRTEWRLEITITAVSEYQLCVDHEENVIGWDRDWEEAETWLVWLDSGDHTIGFEGIGDEWDPDKEDLTGALAFLSISDGTQWWTNSNWTYDDDPTADPDERTGWCSPGFDQVWEPSHEYAQWGAWPWGEVPPELEGTPAVWIWDDEAVEGRTEYFRFDLSLP